VCVHIFRRLQSRNRVAKRLAQTETGDKQVIYIYIYIYIYINTHTHTHTHTHRVKGEPDAKTTPDTRAENAVTRIAVAVPVNTTSSWLVECTHALVVLHVE